MGIRFFSALHAQDVNLFYTRKPKDRNREYGESQTVLDSVHESLVHRIGRLDRSENERSLEDFQDRSTDEKIRLCLDFSHNCNVFAYR